MRIRYERTSLSPAKIAAVPFPWCTSRSTTKIFLCGWSSSSLFARAAATAMSLNTQNPSPWSRYLSA